MSAPSIVWSCDRCRQNWTQFPTAHYYLLSEERELAIRTASAWCRKCSAPVYCEVLPTVQQVREEHAKLRQARTWRHLFPWRSREQQQLLIDIVGLEHFSDFLTRRRSQPRCLACGSHEVLPGVDRRTVDHIGCGGTLRATDGPRFTFTCGTAIEVRYYDTDGNFLRHAWF